MYFWNLVHFRLHVCTGHRSCATTSLEPRTTRSPPLIWCGHGGGPFRPLPPLIGTWPHPGGETFVLCAILCYRSVRHVNNVKIATKIRKVSTKRWGSHARPHLGNRVALAQFLPRHAPGRARRTLTAPRISRADLRRS